MRRMRNRMMRMPISHESHAFFSVVLLSEPPIEDPKDMENRVFSAAAKEFASLHGDSNPDYFAWRKVFIEPGNDFIEGRGKFSWHTALWVAQTYFKLAEEKNLALARRVQWLQTRMDAAGDGAAAAAASSSSSTPPKKKHTPNLDPQPTSKTVSEGHAWLDWAEKEEKEFNEIGLGKKQFTKGRAKYKGWKSIQGIDYVRITCTKRMFYAESA